MSGNTETFHRYLSHCYLHHKDPADDDTVKFDNQVKRFSSKTQLFCTGGQNPLVLYDSYSSHLQPSVLHTIKQHGIVTLALSSHFSHLLQPLDVSVFPSLKSNVQRLFHYASRERNTLS